MIGGPAIWAVLWIAWGSDRWDLDPSEMRPAPRSTWHAARSSESPKSPSGIDGTRRRPSKSEDPEGARASFDSREDGSSRNFTETADFSPSRGEWPPDIAEALGRLEMARRAAMAGQPVEAWRFEPVRAGYEVMIKAHRDNPALQAEVRTRLAVLGRLEHAADAARKVEAILSRSHRRDQDLARMTRSLAADERAKSKAFRAIGMIQPSSHKTEGRKLYTLIGADGSRRAYLDIPPGIDAEGLIARRVGVRGSVNYDDDLGARLITVRDIEELSGRE